MTDAPFNFGKIQMLFPNPVGVYSIADAERLNPILLAEIAERRKTDPSVVRSNRAGWHSESDFFLRKEPAHAEVSKAIHAAVADITRRVRGPKAQGALQIQINGWINVNPPGAYNVPHDHPGSFWSGCYYISTNPEQEEGDEGGAISFLDMRCAPTGQPLMRSAVFAGSHSMMPKPGALLLFPSNLKHWVHPNNWDQDRITMAFNVFLSAAGPKGGRRPPAPATA